MKILEVEINQISFHDVHLRSTFYASEQDKTFLLQIRTA